MKKLLGLLLMFALLTTSCSDDDEGPDISIEEYLAQNNLNAQITDAGTYYIIDTPGTDPRPSSNSTVTVHYHGYLLNGDVFDSSIDRGEPATFSLSRVIAGWRDGIPLFGTGGKGTLIIPANLAYGSAGTNGIPPNTPIAFDVEIISVN